MLGMPPPWAFIRPASAATAPVLTSLRDVVVDTAGGGRVQIATGTGFLASSVITVDGVDVATTYVSATEVQCTMPAHAAGSVDVKVRNGAAVSGAISVTYTTTETLLSPTLTCKAPYAGAPWVGAVGGRSLVSAAADPDVGAPQNGFTPADFSGTQWLATADANNVLFGAAGTFVALVKVDTVPAPPGAVYQRGNLLSDTSNAETTFGVTTSGFGAVVYSSGAHEVVATCGTGAWHLVQARWDGTTLGCRVDDGDWTTTACGAPDFAVPSTMTCGRSYGGSILFDGEALFVSTSDAAASDANLDKCRALLAQRYDVDV